MDRTTYDRYADENGKLADDIRHKWISTIAIGNGAALFATFSLGFKDGVLLYPALILWASWAFLLGVAAASIAHVATSAEARFHEMYWRASGTKKIWENLGKIDHAAAAQSDVEKYDAKGDTAGNTAGGFALAACALFIIGVAIPLTALTLQHVRG